MNDHVSPATAVLSARDFFAVARDFKFATDAAGLGLGEFTGYGAMFNNVDSHGDMIEPGAFVDTLAERKSQGRDMPPMHVMHGIFGGDGCPAGKWLDIAEDAKGLKVRGKISGMNTDAGKMHFERVKDGAYGGLSIGYSAAEGGTRKPSAEEKVKGIKRVLTKVHLHEISLVDDPSNPMAKFDEVKALLMRRERKEISAGAVSGIGEDDEPGAVAPEILMSRAASSVRACLAMHADCMTGGDSPDADERAEMLGHMQDAHEALTGKRLPEDMKSLPSIRTCEKALRDAGLTRPQALAFVDAGLKRLHEPPRDAEERRRKTSSNQDDETKAAAMAADALSFL